MHARTHAQVVQKTATQAAVDLSLNFPKVKHAKIFTYYKEDITALLGLHATPIPFKHTHPLSILYHVPMCTTLLHLLPISTFQPLDPHYLV